MKKILFVVTGGTLGMRPKGDGPLVPSEAVSDLVHFIPELEEYAQIEFDILCNLDSTLITPDIWLKMAQRIEQVQEQRSHHGVVILHGTDTLAFSASSLSFLLPGLQIPVVVTGSQKPLAMTRSDARNNVLGALEACLDGPTEVMVFFNQSAFRGNRATKSSINDYNAFSSPNYPPLGKVGMHWEWNHDLFWPMTRRPSIAPSLPKSLPHAPLVLPWVPGLDPGDVLQNLKHQWGLVLEAYGTGNLPLSPSSREALLQFMTKGGIVCVRSQVQEGATRLQTYQPGKELLEMGIIPAGDMTREALVTKLMVIKSYGMSAEKARFQLGHSWAGEMDEIA
ncbi:MAG: asparaginase [Acidobacteria bacterium]|nr:asparaginase [Acidobacteriota bacterium]MCB9399276.1 asparaginase [Acidobacteriota bacterium]